MLCVKSLVPFAVNVWSPLIEAKEKRFRVHFQIIFLNLSLSGIFMDVGSQARPTNLFCARLRRKQTSGRRVLTPTSLHVCSKALDVFCNKVYVSVISR